MENFSNSRCYLRRWSAAARANLHLLGLLSDGGVHSHIQHLFALLRMAREQRVERVFIHCFLDGRDTPPPSGVEFIPQLQQKIRETGCWHIASLTGRYYAMDSRQSLGARRARLSRRRSRRFSGETADPVEAVRRSYERDVTDEFVDPIVITGSATPAAPPVGPIRDDGRGDFFQFPRRPRPPDDPRHRRTGFKEFADPKRPKNLLLCLR